MPRGGKLVENLFIFLEGFVLLYRGRCTYIFAVVAEHWGAIGHGGRGCGRTSAGWEHGGGSCGRVGWDLGRAM